MKIIFSHKRKMTSALYAGSFDPLTYGHLDVVKRMSHLFDPLWVIVAQSPWKEHFFSIEERMVLVQESVKGFPSVKVDCYEGLVTQYAKDKGVRILIRSIRSLSDFDYEIEMSSNNKEIYPECETLIAMTSPQYTHISSKMVKEIAIHKGSISHLVPPVVEKAVLKKNKGSN